MKSIDSFKSKNGLGYFGSDARKNLKIETAMTEVISEYCDNEAELYLDSRYARHDGDYFEYLLGYNKKMSMNALKTVIRKQINYALPYLKEEVKKYG